MIYYLTKKQWYLLWSHNKLQWQQSNSYGNHMKKELNNRIKLFNSMFPKLKYNESLNPSDYEKCKGYWGIVEGDEKDITLFLLSL